MDALTGIFIGLHIASVHSAGGMNNDNPGIYIRTESGFSAGTYRNSLMRDTYYAGWTWESESKTWALSTVAASGYRSHLVVAPLLSARLPITDALAARVGYIPKPPGGEGSHVGHLMLEWRL